MKSSRTTATLIVTRVRAIVQRTVVRELVAQSENGSISGTVKDSAGAVVSGGGS